MSYYSPYKKRKTCMKMKLAVLVPTLALGLSINAYAIPKKHHEEKTHKKEKCTKCGKMKSKYSCNKKCMCHEGKCKCPSFIDKIKEKMGMGKNDQMKKNKHKKEHNQKHPKK